MESIVLKKGLVSLLLSTFILSLFFFPVLSTERDYGDSQLRQAISYLKDEFNLSESDYALSEEEFDESLSKLLVDNNYKDVPLIEWLLAFDGSDRFYEDLKEGKDLIVSNYSSFRSIGEFLICEVFTQLPPTSWPDLAAKTAIKGICKLGEVNRFKEVGVRKAASVQVDRYMKAREEGITHEEILKGENIYSPSTLLFDQGWIISVGDTAKPISDTNRV